MIAEGNVEIQLAHMVVVHLTFNRDMNQQSLDQFRPFDLKKNISYQQYFIYQMSSGL